MLLSRASCCGTAAASTQRANAHTHKHTHTPVGATNHVRGSPSTRHHGLLGPCSPACSTTEAAPAAPRARDALSSSCGRGAGRRARAPSSPPASAGPALASPGGPAPPHRRVRPLSRRLRLPRALVAPASPWPASAEPGSTIPQLTARAATVRAAHRVHSIVDTSATLAVPPSFQAKGSSNGASGRRSVQPCAAHTLSPFPAATSPADRQRSPTLPNDARERSTIARSLASVASNCAASRSPASADRAASLASASDRRNL